MTINNVADDCNETSLSAVYLMEEMSLKCHPFSVLIQRTISNYMTFTVFLHFH